MRKLITTLAAVAALSACTPLTTTADPNLPAGPGEGSMPPAPVSTDGLPVTPENVPDEPKDDGLHTVVYELSGTAKASDITYTTPSGMEQTNGTRLPWRKKFKAEAGEFLSVSGQNPGTSGTTRCTITVDGTPIKRGQSSGAYAIVSCDGSLGY